MLTCYLKNEKFLTYRGEDARLSGKALGQLTFLGETPDDLRLLQRVVLRNAAELGGVKELQQRLHNWVMSEGRPIGTDISGVVLPDDSQVAPLKADFDQLLSGEQPYTDSLFEKLLLATDLVRTWLEPAPDDLDDHDLSPFPKLSFVFSIDADSPTSGRESVPVFATFDSPQNIFAISDGSLAAFVRGATKALNGLREKTTWCLSLISPVAAIPYSRRKIADYFVEALRANSERRTKSTLLRLTPRWLEESAKEWNKGRDCKKALLIALHGLFSTDAGTFDGFWNALEARLEELCPGGRSRECFLNNYAVVGWPHDTLGKIDDNASELARLLECYVGTNGPDLIFICHSRGGLVARAISAKLLGQRRWRRRIKGILTFGTPHDGAELAESPVVDETVAYLLMQSGTASPAAFRNFLAYIGHLREQGKESIDGLRDLSPVGNGFSSFLSELIEAERKIGWSNTPIFAVGGDASGCPMPLGGSYSRKKNRLASALKPLLDGHMGSNEHDLVVRLDSSLPQWISSKKRSAVTCGHTSYFDQRDPKHYDDALRALTEWMSWNDVSRAYLSKPIY